MFDHLRIAVDGALVIFAVGVDDVADDTREKQERIPPLLIRYLLVSGAVRVPHVEISGRLALREGVSVWTPPASSERFLRRYDEESVARGSLSALSPRLRQ
jgi:hypothetical protein